MKRKFFLRLAVTGILASLGAAVAWSYVLLSPRRTWSFDPNILVDSRGNTSVTDGDGGRTRTRNAINAAWNGGPGCGTVVNATVASISGFRLGDGIPMLNFQDPTGACTGSCLALTFLGYYRQRSNGTYEIYDADIVTNRAHEWTSAGEAGGCNNEFYVESVMVHEAGHVLGLGHSSVPGATMNPSTLRACDNSAATTEEDDRNAVCETY